MDVVPSCCALASVPLGFWAMMYFKTFCTRCDGILFSRSFSDTSFGLTQVSEGLGRVLVRCVVRVAAVRTCDWWVLGRDVNLALLGACR